jgi:hypothetical protein
MDATTKDPQGSNAKLQEARRQTGRKELGKAFVQLLKAVAKVTTGFCLLFLLVLGACDVYDIIFPENVPSVSFIGKHSEESRLVSQNSSKVNLTWGQPLDPEQCWADCQKPLRILKKVCPEAEAWVRERHASGKIVWAEKHDGMYGRYDFISGRLTLTSAFFDQNDGQKAVTMAHEFRHSRQNFTKPFRALIAIMIRREPQEWIVENDACHFEKEVYIAIFER